MLAVKNHISYEVLSSTTNLELMIIIIKIISSNPSYNILLGLNSSKIIRT